MKHFRITFFFLAVALTLSGCGLFGGDDSTDLSVAEDVDAQPTVNSVQAAPAQTATPDPTLGGDNSVSARPTAVTLPTAPPAPEPTVDRSQPTTYIVQSGDVLGLIAERFDADIAELRRINNLDGNLIRVGQELTIPALDGSTSTSGGGDTTDPAPAATAAPAATSAPAVTVSCNSTATGHCVQPGESLLGIALKYDVTVESLRAANPGITGDLIKSGEILNLPGTSTTTTDTTPAATAVPVVTGSTPAPVATVGPINDADCKLRNPEFPYFHAADGLCYANPIGATTVPTAVGASGGDISDVTCPAGRFLWQDGLCYPIPGVTVTPTPGATTSAGSDQDFGRPPCRDGYVVLVTTNKCWPEATNTSPATVTPVPGAGTPTVTPATGTTQTCVAPNFVESGGNCFVTVPEGQAAGCFIEDRVPKCP